MADSLLDALGSAERGGAEIGVANPGGLRAELLYAPDGTITYAEANSVLPFVNNFWTVTLTGAQFRTVLEQQWQRDAWIDYIGDHSPLAPDFARQATIVTGLPASVVAGSSLSFTVAQLDLTSLGSPANTTVHVSLCGSSLGSVPVSVVTAAPDTDAPETTITAGPANGSTIAAATATFSFTSDEEGSTFVCTVDSGAPVDPCSSPFTTGTLLDGTHTFSVAARDGAGNLDPTPATVSFTVDRTPPETTITGEWTFTSSEAGSTFVCQVDSRPVAPCTSPYTMGAQAPGTHTFRVTATDAVGNVDPTPATRTFTPPPPPPPRNCFTIKVLFITITICL